MLANSLGRERPVEVVANLGGQRSYREEGGERVSEGEEGDETL
jgi:hypothetical protein